MPPPILKSSPRSHKGTPPPWKVMTNHDDPGTIQFRLGGLVRQLSMPKFGIALELYTDEFIADEDFPDLFRRIHISLVKCWQALVPGRATYDPSRSKATALTPSLRYLHALIAHTLTGRRESTGVISTHDAYFLWIMKNVHTIDLAHFIAQAIQYQIERHRKVVISMGPYITRLARHFELFNTTAQTSSYTPIGQMSPQGIQTILHMRMIQRRPRTDPL
ncbi:hypothetical protein J1N35_030298 [Gossypium stocksii]|uniref:Uncharacterized protein n=1 Tax=Gossypium stocksii TaxID=47602 RepID=A0A9D3UZF0_9ROSI|nr:hypothetical protein J1N35_030298 [Gossypium stocksii]